jgi:hypothetical protein
MVVYLWLSENSTAVYSEKGCLDFSACTITQGLNLEVLLKAKSFSMTTKKALNDFLRRPDFALTRLSYGFYFNINRQQRQFFAAFGAFSIMLLENFVWRFKLRTVV